MRPCVAASSKMPINPVTFKPRAVATRRAAFSSNRIKSAPIVLPTQWLRARLGAVDLVPHQIWSLHI